MKTQTKKLLVAMGMVLINWTNTFAQNQQFLIGSRFGMGESYLDLKDVSGEKSKLMFAGGISTAYQFNRFFGLTSDILFVAKGGKYTGEAQGTDFFGQSRMYAFDDQYNIYSAEVPLTFKLSIPLGENIAVKAYAGPSFQFQLLGTETRTYNDADFQADNGYANVKLNDLDPLEYGFVYGCGLEVNSIENQVFFIDLRMNNSLSNMGYIQNKEVKSSYYMLSIGYLF